MDDRPSAALHGGIVRLHFFAGCDFGPDPVQSGRPVGCHAPEWRRRGGGKLVTAVTTIVAVVAADGIKFESAVLLSLISQRFTIERMKECAP